MFTARPMETMGVRGGDRRTNRRTPGGPPGRRRRASGAGRRPRTTPAGTEPLRSPREPRRRDGRAAPRRAAPQGRDGDAARHRAVRATAASQDLTHVMIARFRNALIYAVLNLLEMLSDARRSRHKASRTIHHKVRLKTKTVRNRSSSIHFYV